MYIYICIYVYVYMYMYMYTYICIYTCCGEQLYVPYLLTSTKVQNTERRRRDARGEQLYLLYLLYWYKSANH